MKKKNPRSQLELFSVLNLGIHPTYTPAEKIAMPAPSVDRFVENVRQANTPDKTDDTQNARLLTYLKTHGKITPMEAWTQCGIYRTGARIWDLKREPFNCRIVSGRVNVPNRFGETCCVAEYRLEVL